MKELSGQPFAVMVCDLDSFKPVNDQHGHAAGDEVLRAVAARLMQQCRDKDLVVRPGGDEFVVVLPGLLSEERLRAIAARIGLAIGEPVALEGGATVRVGASIGFASTRPQPARKPPAPLPKTPPPHRVSTRSASR